MFCKECGKELYPKFLEFEGMIPYCDNCKEYRFYDFNSAVSVIIFNSDRTKTLLIKQYNTSFFRFVAGYVNKGESLEQCLYREMGEEIGRIPNHIEFNESSYFPKSNSLILNFVVTLTSEDVFPNHEIDSYEWVRIEDAKDALKDARLAYKFYVDYINKVK